MLLLLPENRVVQPQGAVRLNSSAQAKFAYCPSIGSVELATGKPLINTHSSLRNRISVGSEGFRAQSDSLWAAGYEWGDTKLSVANPCIFIGIVTPNDITTTGSILQHWNEAATGAAYAGIFSIEQAATDFRLRYNDGSGAFQTLAFGLTITAGIAYRYAIEVLPAQINIWVNGRLTAACNWTMPSLGSSVSGQLTARILGRGAGGADSAFRGYVSLCAAVSGDAQSLSANPWQIFAPDDASLFFDAAVGGGAVDLSGGAQSVATGAGAITANVAISGASVVIATVNGAANQSVGLSGSSASVSVANGVASITAMLSGNGFVESFASGAIASALAMEAAAQSVAAASGSVAMTVSLAGSALSQALASANLDSGAVNDLSGNAAILATATGGIMQDVPVLGSATVTVTGSGGVSSTMQLEGAAAVSALSSGDLQVSALGLSANAIIQALAGGSIEMTVSVSATALAQALAAGTLSIGDIWSGIVIEKYTATAPERNYTATA